MRTNRTLILNTLLIFILFVSCSSPSDSTNESHKSDESPSYAQIKIIRESAKIIGEPVRIEGLEVAQNDFPEEINWDDAGKACKALGDGWRLPTKDELNLMYLNKDRIGGFANNNYWSSKVYLNDFAWLQFFYNGFQDVSVKSNLNFVRAVRGQEKLILPIILDCKQ